MTNPSSMGPVFSEKGKMWLNVVLRVFLLILGGAGVVILEQARSGSTDAGGQLWLGRFLIAAGLLGALVFPWLVKRFFGQDSDAGQLVKMGALLAQTEAPALAGALTALTQGNLTGRVRLNTLPLDAALEHKTELAHSLNQILTSLQECARSYNWITDEPCQRLLYVGTDSFQEGQTAAAIMGETSGGRGKVMIGFVGSQDNLTLRRNGFQNTLLKNFPGMQVAVVVDTSGKKPAEIKEIYQTALNQNPDLVGFYGTDTESLLPMCELVRDTNRRGKVKIVGFDLTDDFARFIQEGVIVANVSQLPFVQGYDPVIYLYNHLVGKWQAPRGRLLIPPQKVSRENLNENWQIGRGAVQSQKFIEQRPHPIEQLPTRPLKIAIIGLDFAFFYQQVREGVEAAAKVLHNKDVKVEWLLPPGTKTDKGIDVSADLYGPFIEKLPGQGYDAISICMADADR